MNIVFENHAESQVKERSLDKAMIERTIQNPDQLLNARKNRRNAQKVFQTGRLKFLMRAIYVIEGPNFVVISAYRTTNIEKYWVKK